MYVKKINMKILQKIASLLILLSLMSCGGGGGGSSGPAPFSVRLDKASINLTSVVGQTVASDVVTAIASGTYSGQIYVGVVVEGVGIDPINIGMATQGANLYISLQVASGLSAGTYTGRVLFYACSDYYCTHPIGGTPLAVNYTVLIKPGLVVTPNSLTFSAIEGTSTAAQMLGWDTALAATLPLINYTDGSGWLTITSTTGGANVVASAVGLAPGVYRATIVETPQLGTAVSVPVTFTVGAGLVAPADNIITVNTATTSADLNGATTINAANGVPAFSWSAVSNTNWLTLTRSTGLTGTNLTYQVDQTFLQSLAYADSATAIVTVSPVGTSYSPIHFNVTVRKFLPEVYYVGPYTLVNGRAAKLYIRGRGFNSLGIVNVQIPGLTATGQTLVNDSEMTVQITPSSVGNYSVSIANALGLNAGSATLHVIAPQTYTYAAIPSSGQKGAMVFDSQRQSVYVVNLSSNVVSRFRFSGAGWNADSAPLSGILNLGMGPDGSNLVVTSTPGTVQLLDPVTLTTQFMLNVPGGLVRGFAQPISTTNNGRSWLGVGSGTWNEFNYFDHRTHTLMARPSQPNLLTSFYNGPWTSIARNGERMLVVQASGLSPSPPMLYSDAADSFLHANSGGATFTYNVEMSDDGNRVMLVDWYQVLDANFNLVGNTPIPAADAAKYIAVAGTLSPDGVYAYVLAYNSDALNSSPTTIMPRVYVFDSSAMSTNLPLVGTFDLSDYPSCRVIDPSCWGTKVTISPDGNTLFFVGSANFVVVPLPPSFRTLSVMNNATKARSSSMIKGEGVSMPVRPWMLKQ